MTPFYIASQNRIALAVLSVVVITVGAIILFHPLSALSLGSGGPGPRASSAPAAYTSPASSTVFLSEKSATSAAASIQTTDTPMQEVHIANSGMTLLRGARVASVSGGTIALTLTWGGANFGWSVHTTYSTQIYDGSGAKSTVNSIRVGDIVTVSGQLLQTSNQPSVTAQYIHDQSI